MPPKIPIAKSICTGRFASALPLISDQESVQPPELPESVSTVNWIPPSEPVPGAALSDFAMNVRLVPSPVLIAALSTLGPPPWVMPSVQDDAYQVVAPIVNEMSSVSQIDASAC